MITESLTALLSAHDLPEPAPPDPMPLFVGWFRDAEACGKYDDPNAMSLATATPDGRPSVRVVLCKGIEADTGAIHFYTNYGSRKGSELERKSACGGCLPLAHAKPPGSSRGDYRKHRGRKRRVLQESPAALTYRREHQPPEHADRIAAATRRSGPFLAKSVAMGREIRR
jgi:hypothetical protein